MFYIYRWINAENNEVFYVGKGSRQRLTQLSHRNRLVKKYLEENKNWYSEIIEYLEDEKEAFNKEDYWIKYYKNLGQATCNINKGGSGGYASIWSEEKRKYQSEHNPMKREDQRKRMSIKNPMKNKEISQKVSLSKSKAVYINGNYFPTARKASKAFNVNIATIYNWCKRGYDITGNPCRYAKEEQKEYEFRRSGSRKVIIDGIKFNSIKDGAAYLGTTNDNLIHYLKRNKLYKGHTCSYDNQQPSINLKG